MSKKCFTVGYQMLNNYDRGSNPYIRLGGAWLRDELGINIGDKLQLVKGRNMVILMKLPKAE